MSTKHVTYRLDLTPDEMDALDRAALAIRGTLRDGRQKAPSRSYVIGWAIRQTIAPYMTEDNDDDE